MTAAAESTRARTRGIARVPSSIIEHARESPPSHVGAIPGLRNAASEAELFDAPAVVELVVAVRHDEVRDAGLDGLRQRADAAVIHEQRRARQQLR